MNVESLKQSGRIHLEKLAHVLNTPGTPGGTGGSGPSPNTYSRLPTLAAPCLLICCDHLCRVPTQHEPSSKLVSIEVPECYMVLKALLGNSHIILILPSTPYPFMLCYFVLLMLTVSTMPQQTNQRLRHKNKTVRIT